MNTLIGWDIKEQEKRASFMEHMYNCSGRADPLHPQHGLYTNLWKDFCIKEAGYAMRDMWFDRMDFLKDLEELDLLETS